MFHIGHLNIIKRSVKACDKLIVGVNSDALVMDYKGKTPVVSELDRAEIVRNIKGVDQCEIVNTLDKVFLQKRYSFDVVFIGDDWKGNARWEQTQNDLSKIGVDVIFFPYTINVSSTLLRGEVPRRVE